MKLHVLTGTDGEWVRVECARRFLCLALRAASPCKSAPADLSNPHLPITKSGGEGGIRTREAV